MLLVTQTLTDQTDQLGLPPVPRPVTRRAARRAWGEARVRFWWTSALAVLLVAAYIAAGGIREALKLRRVVRDGVDVTATAWRVQGVTASDNANFGVQRDQSVPVDFRATLPDGRTIEFGGYLPAANKWIKVNQKVKLRVDPDDPSNWTEQANPRSWWHVTGIALFIVLPIAAVLLGIALWRRRAVLDVWRRGEPAEGIVLDVRNPAAAPRSRVVHFSLADGRDRRVFKMLYPLRAGLPHKGQALNLLTLPDRPQGAIVADLYTEAPPHGGR
jgi:hypothetical protein